MRTLSLGRIREKAARCVKERRMPYAYYQFRQFLIRHARHAFFFFYQSEYLLSYAKYRLKRRRGEPVRQDYDLVFVVKKNAPGWILEGICREIARYFPGRHTVHYAEGSPVLPPAKAYFFSHYSFFSKCFRKTPDIWGAKSLVWFPHAKEASRGEIQRLIFALNRSTKTVCPCSANLPLLESQGLEPEKATFVLGGADPELFKPHERKNGAVGFCTAYYPRKSPDLMLEIIRSMPHRRFVLLGPESSDPANAHRKWDRYPRFQELLSLPNLTYLEASYPEYPKIYGQMDVLVSTSKVEGGPIPLIEAMMCNIVPVASKTGFASDIIRHGENGFIFEVDASAAEVCRLIERAFELKTDIRASAEHLTWENFSLQIQGLLN